MTTFRRSYLSSCFLTLAFLSLFAVGVSAAAATVLTNLGGTATGTVTGIGPVISLRIPEQITVIGPMQQYDLPLSSIRQISVDFPRLVIETETGVIIGPYSAFSGISELLKLIPNSGHETIEIPVTALRAIAFHGSSLHAVPREWMGDRFLSTPEIVAAKPLVDSECADCGISFPTPSAADTTPIWNTITPVVPEEESTELPGWLGLLGVAALVVIFYFFTSSQSAT